MTDLFLKAINMSLTAVFLILAVILLRLIFKKAPKWISCLLWAIVAIRLLVPFTLETSYSVMPTAEPVKTYAQTSEPYVESGVKVIDTAANKIIRKPENKKTEKATVKAAPQISPAKTSWKPVDLLSVIWISGIAVMLIYALISYLRLRKAVFAAVKISDRVWMCDEIDTPFILGIFNPRIYIPSGLNGDARKYVLEHEYAHLARFDHLWKPLSFVVLAVHWFNPLCWVSYILFGRDVELACDEKAVEDMSKEDKVGYTKTLVNLSCPRKLISACPLAYAEIGVKKRVKSILNYKKPAFWLIAMALISSIALSGCFLTNKPAKTSESSLTEQASETAGLLAAKGEETFDYAALRAAKKNPVPEDILKILSEDNKIECYGNYPGIENINKIVSLDPGITRTLINIGVVDKIVGVSSASTQIYELKSDVTVYNDSSAIIRSLPDIIFITDRTDYQLDVLTLTSSGLCVIKIPDYTSIRHVAEDIRFIGAVIGETDKAESMAQETEKGFSDIKKVCETIKEDDKKNIVFIKDQGVDLSGSQCWEYETNGFYQDIADLIGAEYHYPSKNTDDGYWDYLVEDEFENYMKNTDPDMVFFKAFDLYNPIDKILDSNTNLKNVKAIKNNDCYYLDNTPMSNDTDHIWYGLYDSTIVYKTIYLILSKTYPEQYQELRNSYPEPIRQLM